MSTIGDYYNDVVLPSYQKVIDKQEELLKICLEAFNEIPNKKLKNNSKVKDTYELAALLGITLKMKKKK